MEKLLFIIILLILVVNLTIQLINATTYDNDIISNSQLHQIKQYEIIFF